MFRVLQFNIPKNELHLSIPVFQLPARCVNAFKQLILVSSASLILAGCSLSGLSGSDDDTQPLITSSISKPVEKQGIESTDAELIKTAVADSNNIETLAWQNPDTGNKGTITAIDDFIGQDGKQCKKFQTTVDTFMGISLYNGETCELRKGFWVLSWFLREDG